MKAILKIKALALLAVVGMWGCEQEVTPLHHEAPQVTFPQQETSLTAQVGTPMAFRAQIERGDKLTCGWYVNDILEASTPTMDYAFQAPGSYTVRFEARNGSGKVEKSYEVTVSDVLQMHLSVGDSLSITRRQLDRLKVVAIIDAGADVQHEWLVDGLKCSDKAYFDSFELPDAKTYIVAYKGQNSAGTFTQSFSVVATERPLEVSFSNPDAVITSKQGAVVELIATVLYGGTGVQHRWTVGDTEVSTDAVFRQAFDQAGLYTLTYYAINTKEETVNRTWTINVQPSGALFEDFESITKLSAWWRLGENSPGITLENNPKSEGINTSAKVLCNAVNGTHSTSGFFTLDTNKIPTGTIDVSKYTGIRLKVYLGKNKYYPRLDIGGVKYPSVTKPQFKDTWEVLEYRFPFQIDPAKIIQFRPLLIENGNSIPAGAVSDTNTRTVYFDDIEFVE